MKNLRALPFPQVIGLTHRQFLKTIAPYLVTLGAVFALVSPILASAQGSLPLGFEVSPAVAGAGVERQISISLPWPSGCLPTGATVVGTEFVRRRTLTIRLEGNLQDVQRCGDIIVSYRTTVRFTPSVEGDLRALFVMNDGVYLGDIALHTRGVNSDRSRFDLTGMWYDPVTNGSGLTFMHGHTRNDVLFGTWFVYDALGAPRWYTIQGVQWTMGGLQADGLIYETSANAGVCIPPLIGCPVAFANIVAPARARIVMQGPDSAQIQAITAAGSLLFTSNLIRAIF